MMTLNTIVCASGAALVLGAYQSIAIAAPATASKTAVAPLQESYFPSDAELRELLQTLAEQGQSEGFVLGLLEPGGGRRVIAYGDAGAGAPPLSSRSVFETGSIVKTFTGAILADMVRRGEVSLNDPLSKFLPARVKVPSRNGRQITLLDLATHTSGLPRNVARGKVRDPSNPYADIPIEDVYEFLASHELRRDIGAEWEYSNLGFGLLGHALTRAAGAETTDELVRERITGPLEMSNTQFGRGNGLGASMVKGHGEDGDVVPYWDFGEFKGAGGLNSNVEDMLTYIDANVGEPESPIEAAMRDAHQPRHDLDIKGNSAALGWDYRARPGRTILYKSGSTAGFAGALGFDPVTRAGVVILGNGKGFNSRVDVVLQLLKGGRPEFRKASVPPAQIEPLLGLYEFEGGNRRFFMKDGKLFTRVSGGQDVEVFPAGDDRFFYGPETLSWFEVKRDPAGKHVMSLYPRGSGEALTSIRTGPVPAD